jgi:hypothetical protein
VKSNSTKTKKTGLKLAENAI